MVFILLILGIVKSWTVEKWNKFSYPLIANGTDDWVELNFTTYANLSTKEIFYTDEYEAKP